MRRPRPRPLALLASLLLFAVAATAAAAPAPPAPALPLPLSKGCQAQWLGPCPWSDETALQLRLRVGFSVPDGEDLHILLQPALAVSLARLAAAGVALRGEVGFPTGGPWRHGFGPAEVWLRLGGLYPGDGWIPRTGSRGLSVAGYIELDLAPGGFAGLAPGYATTATYAAIFGWTGDRVTTTFSGGYQTASGAQDLAQPPPPGYAGVQLASSVYVRLGRVVQLGAEALVQAGLSGPALQTTATGLLGLRLVDPDTGRPSGLAYRQGRGDGTGPGGQLLADLDANWGPSYRCPPPRPRPDPDAWWQGLFARQGPAAGPQEAAEVLAGPLVQGLRLGQPAGSWMGVETAPYHARPDSIGCLSTRCIRPVVVAPFGVHLPLQMMPPPPPEAEPAREEQDPREEEAREREDPEARARAAGEALHRGLSGPHSPTSIGPAEGARPEPGSPVYARPYRPSADNTDKMEHGHPPTGTDGHPVEIHHAEQDPNGERVMMTRTDHRLGDSFKRNHPNTGARRGAIDHGAAWQKEKQQRWKIEAQRPENQAQKWPKP